MANSEKCLTCTLEPTACYRDKKCPYTPKSTQRYVPRPKKEGVKRRGYWAKYYEANRQKKLQAANDRLRRIKKQQSINAELSS